MKPSAKHEGYEFIKYLGNGLAVFQENTINGTFEVWASNPNHANYGFHYNNTDWEFVKEYNHETDDKKQTLAIHAEQWYFEKGKIVPPRNTEAWNKMYAQWVAFAFQDFTS